MSKLENFEDNVSWKKIMFAKTIFCNLKNCCENCIKRMLENQIICGYKFSQIWQKSIKSQTFLPIIFVKYIRNFKNSLLPI